MHLNTRLICDYGRGIDKFEESKIVRLVQETILNVKKAELFYDGYVGDLLYDTTNELVDLDELMDCYLNRSIVKHTGFATPEEIVMHYILSGLY